jgi:hypothetical protein
LSVSQEKLKASRITDWLDWLLAPGFWLLALGFGLWALGF